MKAYKNSRNSIVNQWRNTALFYSLAVMPVAMLLGRGPLSVSMIVFVSLALLHTNFLAQLKTAAKTTYLLSFSLLFFIPFASGLWSSNLPQWSDVVRIKLPLLFFPVAFAGNWQLLQKQWNIIAVVFLAVVFAGCVYGLIDYANHTAAVHAGYLRAKTICTPLQNDHVRFSWLVSTAVLVCVLLFQRANQAVTKSVLVATGLFFVIYLHILSARTGLISLYIFLLLYAGWQLLKGRGKWVTVALAVLVLALPVTAYQVLPTFKARVRYILYDFSLVRQQAYTPGSNDGARVMSLRAGWQVLRQNPLGAGAGDVMAEADKWYAAHVPQIVATDKFYPSSEWLLYGAFAGWPGVLLFTWLMITPAFLQPARSKIFWLSLHVTAAFSFVFDMGLEVQYGVFIYAFVALWFWKWLHSFEAPPQALRSSTHN